VTEPNSDNAADLQLLLCDAGDNRPLLGAGLSESALAAAKSPERGPRGQDSMHLEALHSDPNDLHAQRWAVIAPKGAEGDAALAAIAALIEHRGAQQGAAPIIYRVPDAMDAVDSLRWKNDVLRDEDVPVDERPRYLLILGDLHQVSLELQHVLANGSFVGRLHCPTIKGYRAYAEKVIARERATPTPKPRALYYTVQDGSAAIGVGHRHLIEPCMRMTADLVERGKLDSQRPSEIPYSEWGPDEMLAMAGIDAPSLLCSVSHGLGAPRKGWRSPDHQRQMQGALALGPDGPLTADMLRETPFLPGGIWMCVACYGAGTPAASAYHAWLALLAEQGGNREQVDAVLRALPAAGDRPFVAALPQALLANPGGPLAVIGHMDLAWTFGFCDPESKRSRASRMLATQRAILAGGRVGVGLDALMHAYRETNDDLMARYQLQRDASPATRPTPSPPGCSASCGCSATTSAVMCCSATPPRASPSSADSQPRSPRTPTSMPADLQRSRSAARRAPPRRRAPRNNHRPSNHRPSNLRPSNHRAWNHRPSNHRPSHHRPSNHRPSNLRPSNHRASNHRPSNHRPSNHRPSNHRA
jgi:hypothetical protein